MEDENIFEYGPYKLYKDAFKVNLAENIDRYIKEHNLTDPEILQDFRAAVDFIRDGIGSYITYMSGSGLFRDNRGYLSSSKQGHRYAANYVNLIANKLGAKGNATPSKEREELIEEGEKKTLFNPAKHLIGFEFEGSANPLGNDSEYSIWKNGLNNPIEELRKYITTHKASLGNYDFSGTNLTKDFYEKSLNSLLSKLEDNEVNEKDAEMMLKLGFKNPGAFMILLTNPTPAVSNLSEERLAQLMNAGWRIDPATKNWTNPSGLVTQIPGSVDPEVSGKDSGGEQISDLLQGAEGNDLLDEKFWDDVAVTFGPILLDLISIVNPEPISATTAGLASDIWTATQEKDWASNWWRHGLNFISTGAGVIPYIGDIGNMWKVKEKLKKVAKVGGGLMAAATPFLIAYEGKETVDALMWSWNKLVNSAGDEDMNKEDWANILHLVTSLVQFGKYYKTGKNTKQIRELAKLDPDLVAVVRGKDKSSGIERDYIIEGDHVPTLKGATKTEDIKDLFSDRGIELLGLPLQKTKVFNPDLARQMASDKNKHTKNWIEYQVGNDKTGQRMLGNLLGTSTLTPPNRPTKIKTVDDLRNTVKAKLEADGKSAEVIDLVDALIRNVRMDDRGLFTRGWERIGGAKYSAAFEQAVKILVDNGYNRSQATEMLLGVGLHKEGGILKALAGNSAPITGTPKNTNPWYSSIGSHFMTDLIKSISDGKFTHMDVNMMQERHYDLEKRLGKSVNNPIYDSAVEQYYKDINAFGFINNKGIKAGEDSQRYEVNSNAITNDTYNEDVTKAWLPDGYYSGRGLDRTLLGREGDYTQEELASVMDAWKKAGYEMYLNDKDKYYYLKEIATAPEDQKEKSGGNGEGQPREGEADGNIGTGNNNSKEIAPTGQPMTRKPSRNLEPAFSAFNYFNALRTNKKILDKTNEITPLLYDPVEHHRTIHGDLQAIIEGQKQAAEFERLAATPMTSDGSLQHAVLMEAKLKGQESIRAGLKADNDEVKRTTDLAIALEKENKDNRYQVAMKNRENMHQVDLTKLQADATKIRSDYESTKNFVDEIKRYYVTELAKKLKIEGTLYARSLLQDIYKNPLNYMPGWNTYHDDIWKRGIAGKQLTAEEQPVFELLKQLFTNAYYSNLYYNNTPIDTSVKDITGPASEWAIIRSLAALKKVKEEKRGGKITKDDAKIVLEFLKESNKNYNKAVDRSARGMYNHIKLLRKK